jgi:hypothetical protein
VKGARVGGLKLSEIGTHEIGRPKEFFDLYGPQSVGIAGRFLPFRFSPTCGEQGPYFASAEVGPYAASQRIRVFRCGTTPPLFHHADATP